MAIVRNTVNPVIELVWPYLQTDYTVFNVDCQVTGVSIERMLKNEFNEYTVYVLYLHTNHSSKLNNTNTFTFTTRFSHF